MTSRNWCFTINNVSQESAPTLLTLKPPCRYVVWQLERGEHGGRLHSQGYAEFDKPIRISGVKDYLGRSDAHVEPRHGTRDQARDYCRKSDTRVLGPWELGEWAAGGQGRRSDSVEAVKILREGGVKRLLEDMPEYVLKHPKQVQTYQGIVSSYAKSMRELTTIWIWGPPGVGKSYNIFVYLMEEKIEYFALSMMNKDIWWDGYEGQPVLVIDELNSGMIPEHVLLRILDRYPMRLPIKGGMTDAKWDVVIITSNYEPKAIYSDTMGRLSRRVTHTLHPTNQLEMAVQWNSLLMGLCHSHEVAGNTTPPLRNTDCLDGSTLDPNLSE